MHCFQALNSKKHLIIKTKYLITNYLLLPINFDPWISWKTPDSGDLFIIITSLLHSQNGSKCSWLLTAIIWSVKMSKVVCQFETCGNLRNAWANHKCEWRKSASSELNSSCYLSYSYEQYQIYPTFFSFSSNFEMHTNLLPALCFKILRLNYKIHNYFLLIVTDETYWKIKKILESFLTNLTFFVIPQFLKWRKQRWLWFMYFSIQVWIWNIRFCWSHHKKETKIERKIMEGMKKFEV
jgi:hypothetical protein